MNAPQPLPTSIRIFLADGTPDGLRIVEKPNWTGRAISASRSQLKRALQREELGQPGIYVLTGWDQDGARQAYIGESDKLRVRIKQHASAKDFWTRAIAFVSTNQSLNKAYLRYLEARLIRLATDSKQWEIENGTAPAPPPLSEMDKADADWFLAEMRMIFPLLGVDAFEAAASRPARGLLELVLRQKDARAKGREDADGFVVMKGSRANGTETNSIPENVRNQRKHLEGQGVLEAVDNVLVFTQDFQFSSPSAAASVVCGAAANGLIAWKRGNQTLKELQEERLGVVEEIDNE